jgi:hypothetical protein
VSHIIGEFTIDIPTAFEIKHNCSNSNADGCGYPSAFGLTEIYTVAQFWKLTSTRPTEYPQSASIMADMLVSVSGQALSRLYDVQSMYGFVMVRSAYTATDVMEADFVIAGGIYTFETLGFGSNNQGIAQVLIDDVEIIASLDKFRSQTLRNFTTTNTGISISSGRHKLTIRIIGKNQSSEDYGLLFTKLSFIKELPWN